MNEWLPLIRFMRASGDVLVQEIHWPVIPRIGEEVTLLDVDLGPGTPSITWWQVVRIVWHEDRNPHTSLPEFGWVEVRVVPLPPVKT